MDPFRSYDHLEVAEMESPFEVLTEVRSKCPVVHSTAHGGFWALFSHEDIGTVARDPARFSSASGVTIPPHGFPVSLPPIETDPPRHMQFRGPLLERFSPASVATMERDLRAGVRELLNGILHQGSADLAQDVCMPLPGIAVTHLLAIPTQDAPRVREWTVRLIRDVNDIDAIAGAMGYFAEMYKDRQETLGDDIPSVLLSLEIDGRPITEEEYLCTMSTLVMAGLDTTANAGSNILKVLSDHPDLRSSLIADPELIPAALEELIRYVTPLPSLCRTLTEPANIGGQPIDAGQRLQLNWIAANHDPAEFGDPETIRFDRFPNRHFSFGAGPHRCMGAHLARLELKILIEEVLSAMPDYRVVEEGVRRCSGITRGITALPVTFTPAAISSGPQDGFTR